MSVQFKNKMSLYDMNEELKKCLRTDVTTNQEINGLIKLKNIDLNNQNSYVTKNFIIKNLNAFPYKNIIMINAEDYNKYFNDKTKTWTLKDLMQLDGLYNNYYKEINDNIIVSNMRVFLVSAGDSILHGEAYPERIKQGNYYYSDIININNTISNIKLSEIKVGEPLNEITSIILNNNRYSCDTLEIQDLPSVRESEDNDDLSFAYKEITNNINHGAGLINFSYIPHSHDLICGTLPRVYGSYNRSSDVTHDMYPYFICNEEERPLYYDDDTTSFDTFKISFKDPVSYGTSCGITVYRNSRGKYITQSSKAGNGLICIYF